MGDVCTGSPTFTSYSTSTEQTFSVSQSASRSLSVQEASTIERTITVSGLDPVVTQSIIPGTTVTVDVPVDVTVPVQRIVSVPVLTLFAPCSTTDKPTSTSTPVSTPESSSTPVSSSRETLPTSDSQTSTSDRQTPESTSTSVPGSSSGRQAPTPTPTPSRSGSSNNNASQTGTIITTTAVGTTLLPNGSQSLFVTTVTSSIAPNGTLNDNGSTGSSGGGGSGRAVAIGVGVAGGIIALIILVMGVTWHIRRKRRNLADLDEDAWNPDRESKEPNVPRAAIIPEYTYNPYGDGRTTAYVPVPTMSTPQARPMSFSTSGHTPHGSVSSAGIGGLSAPLLARSKTADEILYEAAREGLPQSRTPSVTTRGYGSLTASSHMTHSARNDSVVGLLESQSEGRTERALDEHAHEDDRPASPVSIAAPRLAVTNPDADRDL